MLDTRYIFSCVRATLTECHLTNTRYSEKVRISIAYQSALTIASAWADNPGLRYHLTEEVKRVWRHRYWRYMWSKALEVHDNFHSISDFWHTGAHLKLTLGTTAEWISTKLFIRYEFYFHLESCIDNRYRPTFSISWSFFLSILFIRIYRVEIVHSKV